MTREAQLCSRERVRLALKHKKTDRIPISTFCINEPARQDFDDYLRRERKTDLETFLDKAADIQIAGPEYVGAQLRPGEDIWGVVRKPVSYGPASYDEIVHYPLAHAKGIDDLEKHPWPTADFYDYSGFPERIAAVQKKRERCIMIANANPFETAWFMRGFERMFMDFVLNPELAHYILDRVTTFYIERYTKMLSAADGDIDLAYTADDIGGQRGLLMSFKMWEEFLKPYHQRLNKTIHEFGVRVVYHSDGGVMDAVEGLIDVGIDVLEALQFDAEGMDAHKLKARHGSRLCFQGGLSVQSTMPFGSVEDVRAETEQLIRTLGENGGYIFGPSHAIQAGTPPENIMAMFDTALGYYPFSQAARTIHFI